MSTFILGLLIGIGTTLLITYFLNRRIKYSGNIIVTKPPGKTLYSLELDDDPENIEFKKKVIFKVLVPEESHRK